MKGRKGWPLGRLNDTREPLGPELPPAAELPIRWCIGCNRTTVKGWTYCALCRARLRSGVPLDLEAIPTSADRDRLTELERRQGRAPAGFNFWPRVA